MLQDDTPEDQLEAAPVSIVEQAGAICYRRTKKGQIQVLLVGSRRNGRWGLPKGHVEPGESTSITAAREAFEEAGVRGTVEPAVFGAFRYRKDSSLNSFVVTVHLLEARGSARSFPELGLSKKRWFSCAAAITEAAQPGLRELLLKFQKRSTGSA
ncbi:NUDIX hydrolase [Rhizobium laguerreae]|uniref:NUDIX hydrolase n=1 Tax=Rhizobium laguerreae TaxID=1076926 RepID=UPI001C912CE6|nr:NUDIX hydrolase [Rhizobium laguerreae]MBY3328863.1 NUDIX hydrolase [Rhizobium laguerreae]